MKDNISLSNMSKKTKTARIFTIIIISSHIFFKILGTMDVLNKKIDYLSMKLRAFVYRLNMSQIGFSCS